ncbi:hypothetical protein N0V90_011054 [Kalmusia sp. IMI 367209]|nr:hypothetical protein N0V90_011054 [Kalmusia sp. IMI 367209]
MADFESWLANNKALWTRVYDEIITPDLEKDWKKRIEDHEKESKMKDEQFQILTTHVSNEVVKNAQLQEENVRLKSLLQRQSHGVPPSAEELKLSTDEATITINEYHQVTNKLDELNKRYQESIQRIKYLERKNVAVMQKNKDMKESVKAWQEYCDRHIGKQKVRAEAKSSSAQPRTPAIEAPVASPAVSSSPGSFSTKTPRSLAPHERSSPAPMNALPQTTFRPRTLDTADTSDVGRKDQMDADALMQQEEHAEQSEQLVPSLHEENVRGGRTLNSNNRTAFLGLYGSDKLGSSQTTLDEVPEQNPETTVYTANHVDDDDGPEFVSERSLKRKRNPSRAFDIYHDGSSEGTPAKPVRVKEEQHSSPPSESRIDHILRKETMDLDELGPNPITTPRHRTVKRMNSIHSNTTGTLRNQRSNSAPFSGNLVKVEPNEDVYTADTRPRSHLTIEMEDVRAVSEPGHPILTHRDVLQPIDPNVVATRANEGAPNKRVKREEARSDIEFNILTESGETPPPTNERKKRLPPNLAREHFNERIRAAKSGQSPMKNTISTPRTAPTRISAAEIPTPPSSSNRPIYTPSARPAQRKAPATVPRREVIPDGRPIWGTGAPIEPTRNAPAPTPAKDQTPQVPLRSRPITELRIQDFKPNPRYNQGYTHAFVETVRKRNDRLCLPGCSKPSCCGSTFRTLASAAAPLSSSQEDELLQDYLGDGYDSFGLTQMSQGEREEIVLQARTRKMAREHGKHRQAYEGRKTPPGFWRIDFPTTQEQEEDREKAAAMEQAEVRERWLEAMRKGGKWMFWDE